MTIDCTSGCIKRNVSCAGGRLSYWNDCVIEKCILMTDIVLTQ